MPSVPYHSDPDYVSITENVISSVVNRPVMEVWENTLYNKEIWEEWLLDPALDTDIDIDGSINMTGDIDVDGYLAGGSYIEIDDYLYAKGHLKTDSYAQVGTDLTVLGESSLQGGFTANGASSVEGAQLHTFTNDNGGTGGRYSLLADSQADGEGGLLIRTGDQTDAEKALAVYNYNNDPVVEIKATSGDFTLGNQANLSKYDTDGVLYQIIDDDAKINRAVYNDLAEFMPKEEEVEPGDVLVWGEDGVKASTKASDEKVMGVYSDNYGIYMGGDNVSEEENLKKYAPQGLCGRVQVKAVGPIEKMELLETSEIKGHARASKNKTPGTIIGKALESLKEGEKKKIWMFIHNS